MLLDQVRAMPDIASAAMSKWPLMSGAGWSGWVRVPGRQPDDREVYFLEVTPGFFDTMRTRLLVGRDLVDQESDNEGAVVVNETFARRYFNGESPHGPALRATRTNPFRANRGPAADFGLVADAKITICARRRRPWSICHSAVHGMVTR